MKLKKDSAQKSVYNDLEIPCLRKELRQAKFLNEINCATPLLPGNEYEEQKAF